jgi:HPt (histidine-containing phosphotransfer) domain-containing protein
MAAQMPVRHRDLYHTMSQSAFDSAVASLDARIPTLGRHQIILELARIVALVGDGHTNIAPTRDPRIGFRGYPIALYLFSDGLYVRAADSAHARLVGAREARRGGDAGALRSAAHALRGSAGNFMAKGTVDAALRLEMAAAEGDLVLAGSVLDGLKQSVERLVQELAEMRDRDGSDAPRLSGGR